MFAFKNLLKYVFTLGGVNNLHGMPGLISGIGGAIVAAVATRESFTVNGDKNRLYTFYPSRIPKLNTTEYFSLNLNGTAYKDGDDGRSAVVQGGYQMAALALTLGLAIVSGLLTGALIRLPIFEQIKDTEDMFDDESSWITPSNF